MSMMDYYGAGDLCDFGIAGEDFVGALTAPKAMVPRGLNFGGARGLSLSAAQKGMLLQGAKMAAAQQQSQRLRKLSYAGLIPQIPLGVRSDSVAANTATTISPEPGVPMRVTNFTVSPTIAGLFLITQITVARVNLLASGDGVPATLFEPASRHPPFENPILAAGSQITVGVENIDSAAHPFYGAFQGIDLTPPYARNV